jgi:mono/diheme cytochrome c family protein/plastocyanin
MKAEHAARLAAVLVVAAPLVAVLAIRGARSRDGHDVVEIHGRMPEIGGWNPTNLKARVGEPLHLRLTSDDVMHGFAVGGLEEPRVDVEPGKVTQTTVTFSRPGKYVFYCTRWCGPSHWRMRGTIEVTGPGEPLTTEPALYLTLGLDLDAPRSSDVVPPRAPSAELAASYGVRLPEAYTAPDFLRRHTPVELWRLLRSDPGTAGLSDMQVWDLVALAWWRSTSPETVEAGRALYRANCAACHGERGKGDGVMAAYLEPDSVVEFGRSTVEPADFTDAERMLSASPALLQGKIVRGGMGTGMPYWGPIFTEEQTWAIVDFLWTFQFAFPDTARTADIRDGASAPE